MSSETVKELRNLANTLHREDWPYSAELVRRAAERMQRMEIEIVRQNDEIFELKERR